MRASRAVAGAKAEALAADFLAARGITMLERNFRRRCGELDLVARDGDTLVFVEVRLRTRSDFGGAAASITAGNARGWQRPRASISPACAARRRAASTPCCSTRSIRRASNG